MTRYHRSYAHVVIAFLVSPSWASFYSEDSMPRRRDRPQSAAPVVMTDADISAASHVLSRKHQRGELTDDEFAALDSALRREHSRG